MSRFKSAWRVNMAPMAPSMCSLLPPIFDHFFVFARGFVFVVTGTQLETYLRGLLGLIVFGTPEFAEQYITSVSSFKAEAATR